MSSLKAFIGEYVPIPAIKGALAQHDWAWENYRRTVRNLVERFSVRSVIEIGGGRCPSFGRDEVETLGIDLAINDISERELRLAPDWLHKTCFDISAPQIPQSEECRYDLAISKMVMEHVKDGRQTYRNIHGLLKPGGMFFHFFPVLYSPPFVLNRLLPDGLTRKVLANVFPERNDDAFPKFPAYYSYCTLSRKTESMLSDAGFREVALVPVYGHRYFQRIPVLRELDALLADYARARDWRRLASYCYAFGRR